MATCELEKHTGDGLWLGALQPMQYVSEVRRDDSNFMQGRVPAADGHTEGVFKSSSFVFPAFGNLLTNLVYCDRAVFGNTR